MKWTAFKSYDWTQFCDVVTQRAGAFGWQSGSQVHSLSGWNGTANFYENVQLLRSGWPEGRARIVAGVEALQAAQDDYSPQWAMDAAGAFPDVGAYLAGDIEHMHSPDLEQPAAPILRLCVAGVTASTVEPWEMENFGIALLTLIDSLERAGRQIELSYHATMGITKPARRGSKKRIWAGLPPCTVQVTLKHAGEHMDLDRLAYAVAHPAMLRRSVFAVMEQHGAYSALGENFGSPIDYPSEAKDEETIYFPRLDPDLYNLNSPAMALETLRRYVEL